MRPASLSLRSLPVFFLVLALFAVAILSPALVRGGSSAMGGADGSFETGLTGTTSQGEVRLVANVGALLPTQGSQAALLTSEPDRGSAPSDVDTSVLRIDHVTIDAHTTQLRLDYNVFTNEGTDDVANDRFVVDLVDSSGQETLLEVDTFSTLYPAPLTPFARQTGFRTLVADVSTYAGSGETVTLELRLTDVGDGRLDSAVLVDNLQLTRADEPLATANVEYLAIEPDETFIFDGFASPDANGDITEYRWDFGDGTGAFGPIAEHAYDTPGLYQATLTVTDRDGNQQTDTFLVAVGAVSTSPLITSTAPLLVPQGGLYRYDVEAEDADLATGDVLTYSLVQAPAGMAIDPHTGLIEWRPTANSPRQALVRVEVRDRVGQLDRQAFTLVVGAEAFVVATTERGRVYAASSMGDGTFGPLTFVHQMGIHARGIALADFDADGDFDIVTGHATNPQLALYYLENQGASFASPARLGTVGDSTSPSGQWARDFAAADTPPPSISHKPSGNSGQRPCASITSSGIPTSTPHLAPSFGLMRSASLGARWKGALPSVRFPPPAATAAASMPPMSMATAMSTGCAARVPPAFCNSTWAMAPGSSPPPK